jgi:hypothetical protein
MEKVVPKWVLIETPYRHWVCNECRLKCDHKTELQPRLCLINASESTKAFNDRYHIVPEA